MTKKYELAHLSNEMYMVDKTKKLDWNEYMLLTDAHGNMTGFDVMGSDTDWTHTDSPVIIASSDKSLGLPLLPSIESDPQDIAREYFENKYKNNSRKTSGSYDEIWGFVAGYQTAAANKYSEEDMRRAYTKGWEDQRLGLNNHNFDKDWLEDFNPKPIAVEVELCGCSCADICPNGKVGSEYQCPKVENNFVNVVKWIYE